MFVITIPKKTHDKFMGDHGHFIYIVHKCRFNVYGFLPTDDFMFMGIWSAFIVFYPRSDIEKHGQNHCLVVRIAIGLWPFTVLEFNSKYDYLSCDGKF